MAGVPGVCCGLAKCPQKARMLTELVPILLGDGGTFRRWGQFGVSWDALEWIIGDSFE